MPSGERGFAGLITLETAGTNDDRDPGMRRDNRSRVLYTAIREA